MALASSIKNDVLIKNKSTITNSDAVIIEATVSEMDGVYSVSVSLEKTLVSVNHDGRGIRKILQRLETIGYVGKVLHDQTQSKQLDALEKKKERAYWKRMFLISLLFATPYLVVSMILMDYLMEWNMVEVIPGLTRINLIGLLSSIPIQFYVGRDFYKNAWKNVKRGNSNMDVLVVTGTSIAFFYSFFGLLGSVISPSDMEPYIVFDTSVMLITFVTMGKYLENVAKGQTSKALTKLMTLTPDECLLVAKDLSEQIISVDLLQIGDVVKVAPSERIPCDGKVIKGSSAVDESMITGESLPVAKHLDSTVIGGTMNTLDMCKLIRWVKIQCWQRLQVGERCSSGKGSD